MDGVFSSEENSDEESNESDENRQVKSPMEQNFTDITHKINKQ